MPRGCRGSLPLQDLAWQMGVLNIQLTIGSPSRVPQVPPNTESTLTSPHLPHLRPREGRKEFKAAGFSDLLPPPTPCLEERNSGPLWKRGTKPPLQGPMSPKIQSRLCFSLPEAGARDGGEQLIHSSASVCRAPTVRQVLGMRL